MPRFTLTAFAGFVDVFRLASDEGDLSRRILADWDILDVNGGGTPLVSSCGASVAVTAPLGTPEAYDYVVVVGGLLHGGPQALPQVDAFLRQAAAGKCQLVGLCTGSFVLARAGVLSGYLACVSWFHREAFLQAFPNQRVVFRQMYVVDRNRLTCAGGTSVVHLAAHIVEKTLGRGNAVKALRIMIENQPLPPRTLQPEEVLTRRSEDSLVHRTMLLLEQQLQDNKPISVICQSLGISRRQLERRFMRDIGLSPIGYRQKLRLERARWMLENTDLEVMAVALECGFQDAAHFSRLIRKAFGASPRALRQQQDHSEPVKH